MEGDILINSTLAYCRACGRSEMARIVARRGGVYMERMCRKEVPSVKIANDYKWYIERMSYAEYAVPRPAAGKKLKGCPNDCGPCAMHAGGLRLPVFSITNDCNLDCPKCFTYNRPDKKYYKSVADTKKIIKEIIRLSGGVQVMNLTGGEPTLHPELGKIIKACRHKKIGRITMNTNGLRLARDPGLAAELKSLGVQAVISVDTFNPAKSRRIAGRDVTAEKRKALEALEKHGVPTTILSTCIKDVNDAEVAGIAREYIAKDFMRSVTIQNMTFTGRNGEHFKPRRHITIDEVENLLEKAGPFSQEDFFPLGGYHPLCYSVAYYLHNAGRLTPLAKLADKRKLSAAASGGYLPRPSGELARDMLDGINRLWAEGRDAAELQALRKRAMTFQAGDTVPEEHIRAVYIHPHMDEDNFDIDRVSRCGDLVPDEKGRMIPACSYNLLYRQKDPRFWVE